MRMGCQERERKRKPEIEPYLQDICWCAIHERDVTEKPRGYVEHTLWTGEKCENASIQTCVFCDSHVHLNLSLLPALHPPP